MNQESRRAGKTKRPDGVALQVSLDRGLADVQAGRVRPIEDVKQMLSQWIVNLPNNFHS